MTDRTVRTLTLLQERASTARLLNLLRVHRMHGQDPAHAAKPLFKHPLLNKSLIVKHRLRRNEEDLLADRRRTATKLILPIDDAALKLGGRFVFVNQINYNALMGELLGHAWAADTADRELLGLIDQLPSLDPFLLREHLRRHGRDPARCYFELSDADTDRMFKFIQREVQRLIDLSYAGRASDDRRAASLVRKILSSTVDAETEPLRLTLRLEKPEYQEGVFCWKGFLYYKWSLREIMLDVTRVTNAIVAVRPRGPLDAETAAYLAKARGGLQASILGALEAANKSLKRYDTAFAALIDGKPQLFRDFLLDAPSMFCELGERLGAVSHVVSFWKFRFPAGTRIVVSGPDLVDIISDFEESLVFAKPQPGPRLLTC